MKNCVEICGDLFDVVLRIKAIDDGYKIFYDKNKGVFELHNARLKPSFQLVLPYKRLDKRAVDYVYTTRVENIFRKLVDIENYNEELVKRENEKKADEGKYKVKQVAKYLYGGGDEIPSFHTI